MSNEIIVNTHDILDSMPLYKVISSMQKALDTNKELSILIENSDIIDKSGRISNSFRSTDISDIFVALDTVLSTDSKSRVGSCLNIHNALKSIRLSNIIRVETGLEELDETAELEKYFILSALWCKKIKLSNMNSQYKKCGFISDTDKINLDIIINFCKAYIPNADIELDIDGEDKEITYRNIIALKYDSKIIMV